MHLIKKCILGDNYESAFVLQIKKDISRQIYRKSITKTCFTHKLNLVFGRGTQNENATLCTTPNCHSKELLHDLRDGTIVRHIYIHVNK